MKLMPDCSNCCICSVAGGGCLAGIGDDDYSPATKEQVIERLDNHKYEWDRKKMIQYLKEEFDYNYTEE